MRILEPKGFQAALRRHQPRHGWGGSAQRAAASAAARPFNPSARRVVVKLRVVHVDKPWEQRAAKQHLAYLAREQAQPDGSPGVLFDQEGPIVRREFGQPLPDEQHQFRVVLSPEDGHELDLDEYVRTYMGRLERDLGRKLRWAAVSHYNTDQPHAHIVIRGVDAEGVPLRLEREYIAHVMRQRAVELATEELGPRPEHSRIAQLKREALLERYTSLDRQLERRARGGLFRPALDAARDPHLAAALRTRLEVLEKLGLAQRTWQQADWKLHPKLRDELGRMARRADAMRALGHARYVSPNRYRILDRDEPPQSERAELERGVVGVLRWKGLDEQGRFCAVIETTDGLAYHLPVSSRATYDLREGQIVEVKRAIDKDQKIEEAAQKNGWVYDPSGLPEGARAAYQARLEQLVRMKLAAPDPASSSRWHVQPDFRARVAEGPPQPYWQMLSLRGETQPLERQPKYEGHVWLDRAGLDPARLSPVGFGREVQEALSERQAHLRKLGLDPANPKLRWRLLDRQRRRLEEVLQARGRSCVPPSEAFEGTVHLQAGENGQQFLEVRAADGRSAVLPAFRNARQLDGALVRIRLDDKRRPTLDVLVPHRERVPPERGGPER